MGHVVQRYIEDVMFRPPLPKLMYPLDLAESGGCEGPRARAAFRDTAVPCVSAECVRPRMLIVYFHGNSENLATLHPFARDLGTVLDADVVAPEYPGYWASSSDERPTEAACFAAVEHFVDHIKRVADLPVVFFGYSMGCALALHAAHVHRGERFPAAIVLLAPFVSAASVQLAHGPMALRASPLWGLVDVFAMRTAALQQGHPIIVFGAAQDEVIPPSHSAYIASLAAKHGRCEYHLVEGATHASIRSDRTGEVYAAVGAFLESVLERV
jgi:pimeloyl-ACP methyl ester carboxylesterase